MARYCCVCQIKALKIIHINSDSIEVACIRKVDCNTNMGNAKEAETRQEDLVVMESCTNMEAVLEVDNSANGPSSNTSKNKQIISCLPPNIEVDKRKSIELTQYITKYLKMCLMALGASKAHFPCSSSLIASPIKCP